MYKCSVCGREATIAVVRGARKVVGHVCKDHMEAVAHICKEDMDFGTMRFETVRVA